MDTPVIQPEISAPQQPIPTAVNKKFSLVPIALTAIVLLLFSSSLYLAYQNVQLQKQILALKNLPNPSPTPISDLTANWKTYTDNTYGFSFKYPESLTISNFYDQTTNLPIKSVLFGFEFKNSQNQTINTFTIYDSGSATIDSWITTNRNIALPADISTKSQLSIGELTVWKIPYVYGTKYVFSNNQNKVYVLGTSGSSVVAEQILSTFTFKEQAPTPTCRPRPACLDATPRCMIPETSDMCPKASPTPVSTDQKVPGIQISKCCSCPTMVDQSVIGTNGWVSYVQGKDYSSQITQNCTTVACSPCPPLQQTTYTCPPGGYVDCMPVLTPEKQAACSADAMAWYAANCPDFKGGAL